MSWDPNDYAPTMGEQDRIDAAEEDARTEAAAQEEEEQDAREIAFAKTETPWCEDACFDKLQHTVACQAINAPVMAALNGWREAISPAPRVIEYVDNSWLRTPSVGQQLSQLARKRRAA